MTTTAGPGPRSGIYYGWWILAAAAVGEMLSVGSSSYAFGFFVKPLQEEYGLSRADANMGQVVLQVGLALFAIVVGRCLDRYPVRNVMIVGSAMMFVGLVCVAISQPLWMMAFFLFFLVAPGASAMGPIAAATLVTRWFNRRRGLAMGLATAATSMGGVLVPKLMVIFIAMLGWRHALIAHAGVIIVTITLIAWLMIRDRPGPVELAADGGSEHTAESVAANASAPRWTWWQLVRTRNFWLILLTVALLLCIAQAMIITIVPYASDRGFTPESAALLLMLQSVSGIVGKVLVGYASDFIDKRWLMIVAAVCTIAFLLILLTGPSFTVLACACVLIGLSIGGALPVWQSMVADCFGPRSYGTVIGAMNPFMLPLYIGSMRFVGVVFDRDRNYDLAFKTFIGFAVLSAVLVMFIRLPGKQATATPAAALA